MDKKNALTLLSLAKVISDEDAARKFLEARRWPNGPTCSHCGHGKAYPLVPKKPSKRPVRPGVWKCAKCRKQFSVTTNTVFHGSRIGLHKWLAALHLIASAKKGVSAAQIQRQLGLTYKCAWFVCHRVREALAHDGGAGLLGGEGVVVESDETYLGGRKPRGMPGRGGVGKTPVQAIVERKGRVVAKALKAADSTEIRGNVGRFADRASRIDTDEAAAYRGIGRAFKGGHGTVNHSERFVDRETLATTNSAECFFSLLKRAHYGTHHVWSKKHLQRYLDERSFHWNTRRMEDGDRMEGMIARVGGKRLMYKDLVKVVE